jgi:pimeloyl-ACP methyl ester carboxylesterase
MARNKAVRVAVGRAVVGAASIVAPGVIERWIMDRFFTPRRTAEPDTGPVGEEWAIRSGGEEIAVYSAGVAPRVLLVHGWEGRSEDLSSMAHALQSAGYGIVAFDHPAHGRSSGKRTTLPTMSRAVLDVARAAGPFAAVVGHSLGASATLLALSNGLPARCAILIAPAYDERVFVHQLGSYLGTTQPRINGVIRRLERGTDAVGARVTDRAAARIGVPGLVLHDRSDRAVPFSHGVSVAAAWPGARFIPLDGLGHRRVLDAPTVHAEILTFIRQSIAEPTSRASHRVRPMVSAPEASL